MQTADLAAGRTRVAIVVGTRPEVIKMAPLVHALKGRSDRFDPMIINTGQHREIVHQAFAAFNLAPDLDLHLMTDNQTLAGFSSRALVQLDQAFGDLKPEIVLVQGDTTTVHMAALTARYHQIRVGHVEAGLRSFDDARPFPEEINRRATAALATVHFAPTRLSRHNLLHEGVPADRIHVTGNTVVDALKSIDAHGPFDEPELREVDFEGRTVALVTAHRRESHGEGMEGICHAIRDLTERYDHLDFVFPVHPNPNVGNTVRGILSDVEQVHLVPPVGYYDMLLLLRQCDFAMSDSGGIQEEAPSFGTPVMILRDVTERPEVVQAGAARLVGHLREDIVAAVTELLEDSELFYSMASAENPFGDGHASDRIASVLAGEEIEPFDSPADLPLLDAVV